MQNEMIKHQSCFVLFDNIQLTMNSHKAEKTISLCIMHCALYIEKGLGSAKTFFCQSYIVHKLSCPVDRARHIFLLLSFKEEADPLRS